MPCTGNNELRQLLSIYAVNGWVVSTVTTGNGLIGLHLNKVSFIRRPPASTRLRVCERVRTVLRCWG